MFRRTYKYHMRPNKASVSFMADAMETHRRLYNDALGWRVHCYEAYGETFSLYDQQKAYARVRKTNPFLARCNAYSINLTLQRLDKAYQSFFRRCKTGGPAGFPKFCSIDRFNTISFGQNNGYKVKPPEDGGKWGKLQLTEMVEGKPQHHNIRVKFHRPLPEGAKQKQISITREGGRWYLCIALEIPDEKPSCGKGKVGVDVGLKEFATLSNGETMGCSRILERNLRKLRVANRSLSRKADKRSNRRRRCRERLAAIHRKVRNTRRDMHNKTAKVLVDQFDGIGIEDLKVANMMQSRSYSRRIGDAGWSQFMTILDATATRRGAEVVAVPPHYTSQDCSGCGTRVPKSISTRTHKCPNCGLVMDRDENAARNILDRAFGAKKKQKNKKTKKVTA